MSTERPIKWLILLIEDEEQDAIAFQKAIKEHHTVLRAGSLKEADELLTVHDPDAIIADIGLPDGGFEEVVNWLLVRHQHTACIVYSGSQECVDMARKAGFNSIRKELYSADHTEEINRVLMEAAREVMKRIREQIGASLSA